MHARGFTYVELLIVGTILMVVSTLGIVSINKLQTKTSAETLMLQIKTDMRSQQLAAMNGATGETLMPTGIYFENNRYTLFFGNNYDSNSDSNFVVNIDSPWELSTTLSGSTVIFASGSGEIDTIASGQRSVAVNRSDSGDTATLYINKYGAIQD